MKIKNKFISAATLAASASATVSLLNKVIFQKAADEFPRRNFISHIYHWRFGDISYTKSGFGRPILLIHSLDSVSSSYEWHKLLEPLAQKRTVYTIDLLGCGFSEKPDFIYTNFVYVQLINDFVTNVIGRRTDVVTSEASSSIALMSCIYNQDLFDKIILINPSSLVYCNQIPNKISKLCRFYYNLPVFGTFAYNIAFSKKCIREDLRKQFYDNTRITPKLVNVLHHNAHTGGSHAKYLHSSIKGNYTNVSISKVLKKINNGVYILGGEAVFDINETIADYQTLNPAIEEFILSDSKHYIALEHPKAILDVLNCI